MEAHPYVLVATIYALLGAGLSALYYFSPRARSEPAVHLLTFPVILLATALVLLYTSIDFQRFAAYHASLQVYLLFGASLFHAPVVIFLILHYWESLIQTVTSPGSRDGGPREPRTEREKWRAIEARLKVLAETPGDVATRERLGDIYANMGLYDSAVYEYRRAADWLDRGYAQGHLLYKAAHLLVEKKRDIPGALILLRRIVRLYPKSFFAAYARRILNHHAAREAIRPRTQGADG